MGRTRIAIYYPQMVPQTGLYPKEMSIQPVPADRPARKPIQYIDKVCECSIVEAVNEKFPDS